MVRSVVIGGGGGGHMDERGPQHMDEWRGACE